MGEPTEESTKTTAAAAPANSDPTKGEKKAENKNQSNRSAKEGESGKEAKLRKKAEAQARRAATKSSHGTAQAAPAGAKDASNSKSAQKGIPSRPRRGTQGAQDAVPPARGTANNKAGKESPQAMRPSEANPSASTNRASKSEVARFSRDSAFSDIPAREKAQVVHASKDVHPAILSLGMAIANNTLCGSSARAVAMLLAFKNVIHDYTTPPGTSFARHFTGQHLAKQIDFLISCRPLAPPMGNAVRWLKASTIRVDTDASEFETKKELNRDIDDFIRDRFTAATAVIANDAGSKIADCDVIGTYAASSTVHATLAQAHREGKKFHVFVFNSKPLNEGEAMAAALREEGIDAEAASLSSLPRLVKKITKVFLGTTALTSNGCNYSRVGTSIVALTAHLKNVPVIVLAQTIKFIDRPLVSGFEMNENGPSEELIPPLRTQRGENDPDTDDGKSLERLTAWDEKKGVKILNLMYDLTPSKRISLILCEYGQVHPHAVPAMLKMIRGKDQWDSGAA